MARDQVVLRVNWAIVFEDLKKAGLSLRQTAAEVGVSHAALCQSKYGDMKHSTGERLITLWIQKTGQVREALPLSDGLDVQC